jgi:hypothetical protein
MAWLMISLAYLAGHALLYLTLLRRTRTCTSEQGIFLYHLISALGFSTMALAMLALQPSITSPAFAVGSIMVHGIYSLSFLEAWSLTQGSYSFQILRAIGTSERSGSSIDVSDLERIGQGKQQSRSSALERLGWVVRSERGLELTARGQAVAGVVEGVRRLVSTTPGQ